MSLPFEQRSSHHPNQTNIHGAAGCMTGEGSACTACCHFFEVVPLQKPSHEACSHLCQSGCGIHNQPIQPDICREYHCSREAVVLQNPLMTDSIIRRVAFERIVGLLEAAQQNAEITDENFALMYQFWLSAKANVFTFSDDEE